MKFRKTHILILDEDDPQKELEFEVKFQLSLSESERYEAMYRLCKDGLKMLKTYGYSKTPKIVIRT